MPVTRSLTLRTSVLLVSCGLLGGCATLSTAVAKFDFWSETPPPLETLAPLNEVEFFDPRHIGSLTEARAAYQKKDYTTALHECYGLAHAGNAEAQHLLAEMFARGEGIPRDPRQARYWYERAAEQGNPDSQHALGMLLWQGEYLKQDRRAALDWILKAARQQHAQAQYFLGRRYLDNHVAETDTPGIQSDTAIAFSWLEKSARNGYAAAQHNVAVMYQYGVGVPVDYARAKFWFEQASRTDTPTIAYDFAHFYQIQSSPYADQERALYWLKKAAMEGHAEANRELAALQKQVSLGAHSLMLFDAPLAVTSREDMRRAVRKQGALVLSEPRDGWFDTYDSRQVWDASDRLTIGYVLGTSKVAMLQYRLPLADTPRGLAMLREQLQGRYGPAADRGDQILVDGIYNEWQAKDTQIILSRGENRALFLSYYVKPAYQQMTAEQLRHEQQDEKSKQPVRVY